MSTILIIDVYDIILIEVPLGSTYPDSTVHTSEVSIGEVSIGEVSIGEVPIGEVSMYKYEH